MKPNGTDRTMDSNGATARTAATPRTDGLYISDVELHTSCRRMVRFHESGKAAMEVVQVTAEKRPVDLAASVASWLKPGHRDVQFEPCEVDGDHIRFVKHDSEGDITYACRINNDGRSLELNINSAITGTRATYICRFTPVSDPGAATRPATLSGRRPAAVEPPALPDCPFLAYGYDLGGPWRWKVTTDDGPVIDDELLLDWYGYEDAEQGLFVDCATAQMLTLVGFTEDDWDAPGFFDRYDEAQNRLGVMILPYAMADDTADDDEMYILAAGWVTEPGGDLTDPLPVKPHWDFLLREVLRTLDLTPEQKEARWLRASPVTTRGS